MFPVHEYTIDRAKGVARVGKTNPARTYVKGEKDEDGVMQVKYVTVQIKDSELYYFDEGGLRMEGSDVPEYILKDLQKTPLTVGRPIGVDEEQTIKFCQYCPAPDNAMASGAYEEHLVKHLIAAGVQPTTATTPPTATPKAKSKKAA